MADGDVANNFVVLIAERERIGPGGSSAFGESGYRVFAAGRSAEKRAQLQATAAQKKLPLASPAVDVCDPSSVDHGVAAVLAKQARLTCLSTTPA
jgi:NADP-dependent 3-hydroxy acid dehydrogenase YdfG